MPTRRRGGAPAVPPWPSISPTRAGGRGKGVGSLGPLLAWAVVFADLGTSIYYVPGILYAQLGGVASAFVLVTTVAFVLVALEHLEVAHRYPAGGGGVAAAVEAFGPRVGVVSGALMVSAYLLTIALATVTAMHYLATVNPFWPDRALRLVAGGHPDRRASLSWSGPRMVARAGAAGRAGGAGGRTPGCSGPWCASLPPAGLGRDADRRARGCGTSRLDRAGHRASPAPGWPIRGSSRWASWRRRCASRAAR